MNITCPCCHASSSIETIIQDEAARELLALRGECGALWPQLVAYLGCFRPKARALSWSRALKLAKEVLAIEADPRALAIALEETVESLRVKRDQGDVRPLTKHNYLMRVLESTTALPAGPSAPALAGQTRRSKSRMLLADQVLHEWAGDSWLRREVAYGLLALMALPLIKTPDADAVHLTASLWERELMRIGTPVESIDRVRINKAFGSLLSAVKERFPEPAVIWDHMPPRPRQEKLAAPVPAEEREAGRKILRSFLKGEKR